MVVSPEKVHEGTDEQTLAIKEVMGDIQESMEKGGESVEIQKLQESSGEKIKKIDELRMAISKLFDTRIERVNQRDLLVDKKNELIDEITIALNTKGEFGDPEEMIADQVEVTEKAIVDTDQQVQNIKKEIRKLEDELKNLEGN